MLKQFRTAHPVHAPGASPARPSSQAPEHYCTRRFALGPSPCPTHGSVRRITDCPSYYADASPRLGAATAHRSPGASSQLPEHQKNQNRRMVIALKRPGSVNAFGRFARKRRPCRKHQGKKRSQTLLMRKSEKEGPLSVPLLRKKACGSVSETPGAPLFLHGPRQ